MQFLARKGILFLESIKLFMWTWKLLVGSVSLTTSWTLLLVPLKPKAMKIIKEGRKKQM